MDSYKQIVLKPLIRNDPETVRIYHITEEACDRLNMYIADFIETKRLLNEKKEALAVIQSKSQLDEVEDSLIFLDSRIALVVEAMERIAEDMSSLVELRPFRGME